MLRVFLWVLTISWFSLFAACRRAELADEKTPIGACNLLTGAEIERVLGEPLRQAKSNSQPPDGLALSQCYFTLPTTDKSVSLAVWRSAPGMREQPEEIWQARFHGKERDGEEASRPEKEEQEIKREPVLNLGDEAFWSGAGIGGALYVRKGNIFFRVGIGGTDAPEKRIEKTRALAEFVLPRL